jgi:hypothetical protein
MTRNPNLWIAYLVWADCCLCLVAAAPPHPEAQANAEHPQRGNELMGGV